MTKNITLTVDEDVLKQVKIIAASRRTSVNGLVRDYLDSLLAKAREADDARAELLRLVDEKNGDMGSKRWNREALYDR